MPHRYHGTLVREAERGNYRKVERMLALFSPLVLEQWSRNGPRRALMVAHARGYTPIVDMLLASRHLWLTLPGTRLEHLMTMTRSLGGHIEIEDGSARLFLAQAPVIELGRPQ